jgi:Cu(I)/Ag(I) efflux system membrane fusion protein
VKFLIITFLIFSGLPAMAETSGGHAGHGALPTKSATVAPSKAAVITPTPLQEERIPLEIPAPQQEKMGLKTRVAKKEDIEHTIRTVGTVTADETKEAHVHTKINGWIEKVHADFVGKPVKKGQSLFDLYSPDLVSTQEEYLGARKQGEAGREIAKAALERLSLWGVPTKEIEGLKKRGSAKRTITFESPVEGVVIRKTSIQGMYITPEMELYHIADLSRVWLIVTLYEYDLAAVAKGDAASVELPFQPGTVLNGKIGYVYPEVDMETRTAKARIELENAKELLKPGMFANVSLKKKLGDSITVPDDAVIDTGTRKVVFVKSGVSRFEPREVTTGARVGSSFVILAGIKSGEEVVTAAHFLLDAESKFQAAVQRGGSAPAGHTGHGK